MSKNIPTPSITKLSHLALFNTHLKYPFKEYIFWSMCIQSKEALGEYCLSEIRTITTSVQSVNSKIAF